MDGRGQALLQAQAELPGRAAQRNSRAGVTGGEDEPAEGVHGGDVDTRRVAEVEQDAERFRVGAKGLLQTVGQRMGGAEKDVAVQPVRRHALTVHPQDGPDRGLTDRGCCDARAR